MDQATLKKANSLTHKIKNVEARLNDLDYLIECTEASNRNGRYFTAGYSGHTVEIPKTIRKNIFKTIEQEYQRKLNQLQNELKAL